jgi:intracellular sulfur oxidation DsrE/DsrF family protein
MKCIFKFNALATLFALSLTLASLNGHAADMAAATAAHEKVVFQVSDAGPGKWNLTLNNAKNVQDAIGKDNVDIEIVAFGPGIEMLKRDSEVGSKIDKAMADGIKVVACENTMKAMKLTKADMLSTIGYVPGGVVELMKKQKENWSYIRP